MKPSSLINTFCAFALLCAGQAWADRGHHDRHRYRGDRSHYETRHEGHYKKHKHYRHGHHHHPTTVVVYERDYYAPVTEVRPIYRKVAVSVPRDSCHVETVAYRERQGGNSLKGALVGGVVGAAIGRELGNGGPATAAGGLIGVAIGNDIGAGARTVTHYEDREICSTHYRTQYERQLVGYDVSYVYGGRIYHTETRHHPGERIRHR